MDTGGGDAEEKKQDTQQGS